MRRVYGGLSTDIPEDWIDGSILQFQLPSTDEDEAEDEVPQPNLVITRGRSAGADLAEVIMERAQALPDDLENCRIRGRDVLESPAGPVHYVEYTFGPDGAYSQITLLKQVGSEVISITGTADSLRYDDLRAEFMAVATALRPDP